MNKKKELDKCFEKIINKLNEQLDGEGKVSIDEANRTKTLAEAFSILHTTENPVKPANASSGSNA